MGGALVPVVSSPIAAQAFDGLRADRGNARAVASEVPAAAADVALPISFVFTFSLAHRVKVCRGRCVGGPSGRGLHTSAWGSAVVLAMSTFAHESQPHGIVLARRLVIEVAVGDLVAIVDPLVHLLVTHFVDMVRLCLHA